MTLKMTTAQVVETSVTVTDSSFQNYTHPDDHTTRTKNTDKKAKVKKKYDQSYKTYIGVLQQQITEQR